jgi:predicted nucleotidyltransferase
MAVVMVVASLSSQCRCRRARGSLSHALPEAAVLAAYNASVFEPLPSSTNALGLDEAVAKLAESPLVAAIAVFGSGSTNAHNAASDHDMLIVIDHSVIPVRTGVTWISDRLTDLVFVTSAEIAELESLPEVVPLTDDWGGSVRLWVRAARVLFDRDGLIERAQRDLRALRLEVAVSDDERRGRWDHENYNLMQSERYVAADDRVYHEAFDLRMTYQLADAMIDYFRVRGLLWAGEKDAIRYWDRLDPEFKHAYFACLREPDRERRLVLYRDVLARLLEPAGGVWPPLATSMTPRDGHSADEANAFWQRLLSE